MAARTQPAGVGFWLYVAAMILLFLFSFVAMFSIGMLVIPIPVAMLIGILFWGRPTVLAVVVPGLAAGLIGFTGAAPFFCHPEPGVTDCARWFLPSTGGPRTIVDWLLAIGFGLGAGAIAAALGAYLARQSTAGSARRSG
jgi:hypothetical protein